MAKADITLRGRTFSIACAPGQEMRVQRLAEQLDARVGQISQAVGDIGDERLLLITALALLDELDSARRGVPARPDTEARAVEILLRMAGKVEALAARLEAEN
ncbi:MAG: cell division protein ZapA [Hyphomonas sp.]|uniref:cell division protein ZapA n=1 Tax=Hyphomonas sp. TaxID=87 RepID=UPI00185D910D|nr:cell division protein ZapA [Hyphomonas sp.]MBU3920622.1 cell division protein ZapA [Alphaproteobacteria bacterium]MBA3068994.1 cell division protein ZapA [Hyphomonas sp.]MBU4061627.1 cell division protein ZapA [Alphaproteobacteria bacterium]MBU4163472.1 cell division protein ZapA [Alphaproteobacteria bacterium]MBU4567414.1 cell division protein ZapA [Alphaproteobacteria bacterium]